MQWNPGEVADEGAGAGALDSGAAGAGEGEYATGAVWMGGDRGNGAFAAGRLVWIALAAGLEQACSVCYWLKAA